MEGGGGSEDEKMVHLLAFLKTLLQLELLPITSDSALPQKILHLTSSSHNKYIPPLALSVIPLFPSTFAPSDLVKTLLSSPPKRVEKELCEAWVGAFSAVTLEGDDISTEQILKTLLPYLSPPPSKTGASISSFLTANSNPSRTTGIIAHLSSCLVSVDYVQREVVSNVLDIISSYILSLSNSYESYKREDWEPLLNRVSEMRIRSAASFGPAADGLFKSFIRTFGIDRILDILPLNIEPAEMKKKGTVARAFLLPLFGAAQHHPTPLSHFVDYFVPMSERLYTLKEAENEVRATRSLVMHNRYHG
jgi:ribosomal RNA-processing protein 12